MGGNLRRALVAAVLAVALAVPAIGQALAATSIPLPDGFSPMGVAAGRGGTFFVSSAADGDIWQGDLRSMDGEPLVDTTGRVALGIAFDHRGDRLFVAGGHSGQMYVYDSRTGAELAVLDLADPAVGGYVHFVTVTRGAVFVTDNLLPRIYKIPLDPNGELGDVQVIELRTEVPANFNLNGIAAVGPSLVAMDAEGNLFSVNPVTGDTALIDLDGMALPNGFGISFDGHTLWVAQLGNQVSGITLADDLTSGEIVSLINNDDVGGLFREPSAVTSVGNRLLVVNARLLTDPGPNVDYDLIVLPKGS